MRQLYTRAQLESQGLSESAIRWGSRVGRLRMVEDGIYAGGPDDPDEFDRAMAALLATGGVASGTMAGALLELDDVEFQHLDVTVSLTQSNRRPGVRRRRLPAERVVDVAGVRCTDGLQTLIDLACELDDLGWEAALECALRRRLTTMAAVEHAARGSQRGVARMRRVLALRPAGAPPTESLLETRMIQLIRTVPTVPLPARQVEVVDTYGLLVARVDLAWPELGLFVELDGQHHQGQPLYDATRETAIVAATGWLCGRFTWREVVYQPTGTARRLGELVIQARRRPLTP